MNRSLDSQRRLNPPFQRRPTRRGLKWLINLKVLGLLLLINHQHVMQRENAMPHEVKGYEDNHVKHIHEVEAHVEAIHENAQKIELISVSCTEATSKSVHSLGKQAPILPKHS